MPEVSYHQNLRGKSFRNKDLTGLDLSHADIRGADFTGATLTSVNLSHSRTGIRRNWSLILRCLLLALVMLAAFISAYAGVFAGGLTDQIESLAGGLFVASFTLFLFLGFITITSFRGIGTALWLFALAIITSISVILTLPGANNSKLFAILMAMLLAVNINSVLIGVTAVAVAKILSERWLSIDVVVAALIAVMLGGFAGAYELIGEPTLIWALVIMIPLSLTLVALILYIGSCAFKGDQRYKLIRNIAITITSQGGTSFRNADLTDANFSSATLNNSDFRGATLTRTSWHDACYINKSRVDGTYLEQLKIRELVVSKNGFKQDFQGLNLQGLNLENADLSDSNLMGSRLSNSNLRSANLTKANLSQVQLYGADLTGAILTGATIENWAISTDSKLESITCDYIYMRLPTEVDPDPWRKPDNRNEIFRSDDFIDFVSPIIKTLKLYRQQYVDPRRIEITFKSLDLYHYGGIDPAAAAIALQQLAEENPEVGLEIVALEGRGEEKIRLQAAVTDKADSSQLNARYFEKYREIISLPYLDIQALLIGAAQKDERICSLEKLLENALHQPKFYVETYQNQGEFIMSQSKGNVNISGVQGNVNGIAAAGESQTMTGVAIGMISGSVTNTINQLPASPDPNSPGIKELLAQLQTAIEAEPELPDEDKAEALEQVKTLAEAGHKPEDNALQKAAKTSMKILKGTVASLPDAAKLAEACAKLLPAIATLLALV